MTQPKPTTVDFETEGICGRPDYPPKPVGVSIKYWGKKAKYWSWGHPEKNNCTFEEAKAELTKVWNATYDQETPILFQNAKFDLDVAEEHFGLPLPPWDMVHDTMFLLFLDDPHQKELSLKPSSERLLGMAPEVQDKVGTWLVKNQPVDGVKISESKNSPHYFGRYICLAPGSLVGKYANGDVIRTEKLFKLLWKKTIDRGMEAAYDRERQLLPILLEMERNGVPVHTAKLKKDTKLYSEWHTKLSEWICKRLSVKSCDINLDSGAQLIDALVEAEKVDLEKMPLTPTGKFKTSKDALLVGVTDKVLLASLVYRSQLSTCLKTFMRPWLETAMRSKGLIYTTWHQTRSPKGGNTVGTRTGRLSSTPNFQNLPNEFKAIWRHDNPKNKTLPICPKALKDLPHLPQCRSYIAPFKNEVLLGRDFSSQELRVLAHFEGGAMMQAYIDDPTTDFHQKASDMITKNVGIHLTRKAAKNIAFSILYGSGLGALSQSLSTTVDEARELKTSYLHMFPGIKDIQDELKTRAKQNKPVKTAGQREFYCEPPKYSEKFGRLMTFEYKMLNYLIQGSSADQTKDALIRFYNKKTPGRLLMSVHDEIVVSSPKRHKKKVMEALRDAMNDAGLDVPMLSDGESGNNWASMTSYT